MMIKNSTSGKKEILEKMANDKKGSNIITVLMIFLLICTIAFSIYYYLFIYSKVGNDLVSYVMQNN